MLIDTRKFFGKFDEAIESLVQFTATRENPSIDASILNDAEKQTDEGKIPGTNDLKITTVTTMPIRLGIYDSNAARTIRLDPKKFGYALRVDDLVFHRPNCPALTSDDRVIFSNAPFLPADMQDRKMCNQCHPSPEHGDAEV